MSIEEKNAAQYPVMGAGANAAGAMEKATITHVEGVDDKHHPSRVDELAVGERHEKVSLSLRALPLSSTHASSTSSPYSCR